jgi:hypothetical protein
MDAKLLKVQVVSDKAVKLEFETSDNELLNMSIGQLKMMQEKDVTLYSISQFTASLISRICSGKAMTRT